MTEAAWIDASSPPSEDGDYECRVDRDGREFFGTKRFKKGYWFGGCRPFSDDDVVLAWRVKSVPAIDNHKE